MGYIGLLLNAPYKIDSMVWMMMLIMFFYLFFCVLFVILWAIRTRRQNKGIESKTGVPGF
jgi:heme/copper-type cytochrome/quinol oxidase subunit 2